MRLNIYSQELTKEVSIVTQTARDTGIVHHGVRLFIASPSCLHNTSDDDDRSAITFWIPHANRFTASDLAGVFEAMAAATREAGGTNK